MRGNSSPLVTDRGWLFITGGAAGVASQAGKVGTAEVDRFLATITTVIFTHMNHFFVMVRPLKGMDSQTQQIHLLSPHLGFKGLMKQLMC